MYLLITEDGAIYKTENINDQMKEESYDGLLDIIDITGGLTPKQYVGLLSGEYVEVEGAPKS